jgi:hypothetical protein
MSTPFQLCQLLCGDFCNREQAFNNPPIYAHIQVKIRALPQLEPGSLLLKQAYTVAPDEPYRLRVLQVVMEQGLLRIINKAIADEHNYIGATCSVQAHLTLDNKQLTTLKGCTYNVAVEGKGFRGTIEPGCLCLVERNGISTYLDSHFFVDPSGMSTLDRGYNLATNEMQWGSIAGPFEFKRNESVVAPPPDSWLNAWP